ncbi:MAG TPA: hypothetical protein VJH75_02970 [Patescibacteria group bacterium]|nr:hypothetical protein [Patescibacteria group bacterium]
MAVNFRRIIAIFILLVIMVLFGWLVLKGVKAVVNYWQQRGAEKVEAPETLEEVYKDIYAKDNDFDKLTNDEEKSLGTNSAKADSDSDGVLDYDEVKIYGTDPLKADTDSDGHKDKEEILNGFNPKGEGKLQL